MATQNEVLRKTYTFFLDILAEQGQCTCGTLKGILIERLGQAGLKFSEKAFDEVFTKLTTWTNDKPAVVVDVVNILLLGPGALNHPYIQLFPRNVQKRILHYNNTLHFAHGKLFYSVSLNTNRQPHILVDPIVQT